MLLLWGVSPPTRNGWDERVNGGCTIVWGARAKKKEKETKKKSEKLDRVGRPYRKAQGARPRSQQGCRRYNRRIDHGKV